MHNICIRYPIKHSQVNLPPYTESTCTNEAEFAAPLRDTQGMYWGRLVLPQHGELL